MARPNFIGLPLPSTGGGHFSEDQEAVLEGKTNSLHYTWIHIKGFVQEIWAQRRSSREILFLSLYCFQIPAPLWPQPSASNCAEGCDEVQAGGLGHSHCSQRCGLNISPLWATVSSAAKEGTRYCPQSLLRLDMKWTAMHCLRGNVLYKNWVLLIN